MEKVENTGLENKLKPNHINNYINYKWQKLCFLKNQDPTIYCLNE